LSVHPAGRAGKYENIAPSERRLVSLREAASMLSVSRSFVHVLVTRGDLEAVRVGRRLLVVVESIDDYVERKREDAS
jgi:excisionase family DNA binding protein